ncbi:ROK family protein [Notoacmeibacter ruber]|uniref:ROK family protein n=1 Tax=Notoacmeibacter ruber TaxID=2670375 RepID=A0A3L7J3R6_9HYPH|nr:ROK family protein [Notoacmeibacter ruber]RLQ85298.1 ROK family protein [Notoacmeibacter ruber]
MNSDRTLPARLSGAALDIGGTKIAAVRFENGEVAERLTEPTNRAMSGTDLVRSCEQLLLRLDAEPEGPLGVAATGRVTNSGLWSAVNTGTLPNIENLPLAEMLSGALARPVHVLNDAAAAAWAEARWGAAAEAASMVYVTISTGVGGGFVFGGTLLRSENGLAGHVGFMSARESDQICGCGRFGTVESVASGLAIAERAKALGHPVTTKEVFEQWRAGTPWAEELVHDSARTIADLGASLRAGLGLDCMVLGGSVGLSGGYHDLVASYLASEPSMFRIKTAIAAFRHDSPLIGALLFAEERPKGECT